MSDLDNILHLGIGTGLASMGMHTAIFNLLLKRNLINPNEVREFIDGALLHFEQMQGSLDPGQARPAFYAQEQLKSLLESLEATSTAMKATPRPTGS